MVPVVRIVRFYASQHFLECKNRLLLVFIGIIQFSSYSTNIFSRKKKHSAQYQDLSTEKITLFSYMEPNLNVFVLKMSWFKDILKVCFCWRLSSRFKMIIYVTENVNKITFFQMWVLLKSQLSVRWKFTNKKRMLMDCAHNNKVDRVQRHVSTLVCRCVLFMVVLRTMHTYKFNCR